MKILHFDGHLAKDPELKTTTKGTQFLSFRVGNNTYLKGENKTDWIDVASFNANDIATKFPYLKKGSYVYIVGTPDTVVNPGKDGRLYVNTSVLADRIEFISTGKKDKDGESGETTKEDEPSISVNQDEQPDMSIKVNPTDEAPAPAAASDDEGDELPF